MSVGAALTEETMFDERTGRTINATLAEYHVPVQADVPHMEVLCNDIPDEHTALGAHGVGEIGITGCAAALPTPSSTPPVPVSAACPSRWIMCWRGRGALALPTVVSILNGRVSCRCSARGSGKPHHAEAALAAHRAGSVLAGAGR